MKAPTGRVRACTQCKLLYSAPGVASCARDGSRIEQLDSDPWIGQTIDRYLITDVIGDGGMARVYRAKHTFLDQPLALKILYGDIAADPLQVKRFQREATAASKVRHPNVVSVVDFGTTGSGVFFMVMEWLKGEPLARLIATKGPLDPELARTLLRQTAEGLGAAHNSGFIHRDLKTSNLILLDNSSRGAPPQLKIVDFGLVRRLEPTLETSRLTRAGIVYGTPAYMSPEQILGRDLDQRTDLYSLGVVLYEMLAGTPPFVDRAPLALMRKHVHHPLPPMPDPNGLGAIAARLLQKDPAKRFQTAEELLAALAPAPSGSEDATELNLPDRTLVDRGELDTMIERDTIAADPFTSAPTVLDAAAVQDLDSLRSGRTPVEPGVRLIEETPREEARVDPASTRGAAVEPPVAPAPPAPPEAPQQTAPDTAPQPLDAPAFAGQEPTAPDPPPAAKSAWIALAIAVLLGVSLVLAAIEARNAADAEMFDSPTPLEESP